MPNVQEIIVDLQLNTSDLDSAADKLEALGVIDKAAAAQFRAANTEIKNKEAALKSALAAAKASGTASKKTIDDLDKSIKNLTADFVEGFGEGVADALKEAGVSAEEFSEAIKNGGTEISKSSQTVKARLKEITQQLALLKSQGQDNTEQYKALTVEAGNLRDALSDVSDEIKNAGSDTAVFDGLISAAQGAAGGFAVAQGSMALFGDESEQLQETLLRVNAAMAILQGLQQVQTVLQKESAAVRLVTNAQLAIENGLNSTSIVVRTGAAVAQRVLNAAMAANPIGILVVAIAGLIAILGTYGRSAAAARRQTSALNVELSAGADNFKDREEAIRKSGENIVNALENEGAVGSKIAQQEIENQKLLVEARKQRLKELLQLQQDSPDADLEKRQELSKEIRRLQDEEINDRIQGNQLSAKLSIEQRKEELQGIADLAAARLAATVKNSKAELIAAKDVARAKAAVDINAAGQNASEILRIQAELNDQLRDLDRAFNQTRQQDRIAGLEAALTKETSQREKSTIRQSQAEIDLQKRIIQEKANLELLQEGLTTNQVKEIKVKAQADILKLQRDFNKQSAEEALQDFISSNNQQLAAVEITNKEKLNLTIDNIIAQAAIEVDQNKGLSDKIKEINAKRDADIRAARLASIRQTVEEEIDLRNSILGATIRQEEKELSAQSQIRSASTEKEKNRIAETLNVRRLSLQQEFELIDELAQHELDNNNAQLEALNESLRLRLISYKDYNKEYQKLTDQQTKIVEDAEQKKRNAQKETEDEAIAERRRAVDQTVQFTNEAAQIFAQFAQNNTDRQLNQLELQRSAIEQQKKDGKISEKEAEQRLLRLDQAEKRIRRQQAIREKNLAIFNAVIATAAAIAKALPNIPLAAITGLLGAAQVAAIASKPIPQFKRGKKDAYQGPGVVGEAGAELIERDGQLYIAPKKTIVWLGKKDKVFNPKETIAMLEKPGLQTTKVLQMDQTTVQGERLDYEKLGKVIARNTQGVSLNIDGYKDFVIQGHAFDSYLNNRRSYK